MDVRTGSPTWGLHIALELSSDNGRQVFIPTGCAHGFCTLEPEAVVTYKVDAYYAPAADRALLWKDPALGIVWPVTEAQAIVSDKGAAAPGLAACRDIFHYAAKEHPHVVCHPLP